LSRSNINLNRKSNDRYIKSFHDMSSTCHNYKNDYILNLENERMGKRLINTRSIVQDYLEKSFFSYELYNGKIVNKDKFVKIYRDSASFKN